MLHMQLFSSVLDTFGVRLTDYWPDNNAGFNFDKFVAEVIKPRGRPILDVVRKKWGQDAVKLLRKLVPGIRNVEMRVSQKKVASRRTPRRR